MIRVNSSDNVLFRHRPIQSSSQKILYYSNPIIPPQEGIPFQNLYNPDESLLSNLKCSICLNLIWKPIELNECGHTFCEYCIDQSLEKSGNFCPLCKTKPITKRISKTLLRFLNQVKIKCPNKGCNITPDYSDYLSHLEKCNYRLYHCANKECRYNDILSRMKIHVDKCKYRLVYCVYCSKNIKYYQKEGHDKIESKEIIECHKCKVNMTKYEYYNNHYNINDNNISCLKDQVKYWKNEYNQLYSKYNKEIEEAQNLINELMESHKKEVNQYEDKLKKLKGKIEDEKKYSFINNNNEFISNNNNVIENANNYFNYLNINNDMNQNIFNKKEYITLFFKDNYETTSIQCHPDDLLSNIITHFLSN